MCTASSHAATCAACVSASEYTATVRMPIRCAVAATLQAISPRLAIRIFLNIMVFCLPSYAVFACMPNRFSKDLSSSTSGLPVTSNFSP